MNIGRFILSVIAAYIAFAVLFTVAMTFVFPGMMVAFADLMRAPDDPMMMWAYLGHLVQTIVLVWFFEKGFGTKDLMKGAIFGGTFGVYVAATGFVMYMSFKWPTEYMATQMIVDVVIFALVGVVLALVHKPKEA